MKTSTTQERVKELLLYDPDTGVFTWLLANSRNANVGKVAGNVDDKGYRRIGVDGIIYYAHRLAWLYMTGEWPEKLIDHKNGIKDDNRICNLREATHSQNHSNTCIAKNNTTGWKGVKRSGKKFMVQITHKREKLYLGTFDTAEEAHKAYCDKADELYGEFANYGD